MKQLKEYLVAKRSLYFFFGLIHGLNWLTFYLSALDLTAFWDSLLFTGFALIVYTLVDFSRTQRRLAQLRFASRTPAQPNLSQLLPRAASPTEAVYQTLITKNLVEIQRLTQQTNQERQVLLDDFGLWLHQIKTPVAALDLQIQSGQASQVAMQQELIKINDYLQLLLNYLRQNLANQDLVITQVRLDEVVREVVKKYAIFFSQKELRLQLEDLGQTVLTDRKWLSFILEQVIFNSLKYTDKGQITITGGSNQLTISDTGIGIRSEDLPRIFEKGFTGYNGRQQQRASGLGLHLSQKVAHAIGAQLTVTSVIRQGTSVTITFPNELNFD